MNSRKFQISMIVVIVLFTWTASLMAATKWTSIGEWQDTQGRSWKQTIRIFENNGAFALECSFSGGASVQSGLVELKARKGERQRFRDTDSGYKEEYVILSNGDLALYDQEGFIRKAKRK